MNVRSIKGAEQVICEAMGRNRVPATIATALDASGWLNTSVVQAELVRLRLLQNAQPAELSEAQLEALIDAGNSALNDFYHERACSCSEWPAGCATDPDYANGYWDSDTFAVAAAAVVGAWESMRAPAEADALAQEREQRAADRRTWQHDLESLREARAEADRLRAQVAELEAERGTLVAARDDQIIAWLGKKAREYGTSNREARDKAEAVGRMADKLSRGAVRPLEDPHDGPLHQNHRLSRDLELPEQEAPRV